MAESAKTAGGDTSATLSDAVRSFTRPAMVAGLFSMMSNLLYLAMPLYMMTIYGRVLLSHSLETLVVLSIGVVFTLVMSAVFDGLERRVLNSAAERFDRSLSDRLFASLFESASSSRGAANTQTLRDLDTVRGTISGPAVSILFDVPWIPIFIAALYLIHPSLGLATTIGAALLFVLAFLQDRSARPLQKEAGEQSILSYGHAEASLRNAEVVKALGMLGSIGDRWRKLRGAALVKNVAATDLSSFYAGAIKLLRVLMQIVVIALGAYLVISGSVSGGVLFASMMIAGRALNPVEKLVTSYTQISSGLQSYRRIEAVLAKTPPPKAGTPLPRPAGQLTLERVTYGVPGGGKPLVSGVSFRIEAGDCLGVIGPSGAGKTTLTRLLMGIWRPVSGAVRLDGADVSAWERSSFGHHVGYMPQDVGLFGGTVRDNIARFDPSVTDEEVFEAAQLAGAHELILRLSLGYDTELGEGGLTLSAGQRQRVGLARALLRRPAFLVLDEPNANLDSEGEAALAQAIEALGKEGATIVIVSHHPAIFRLCNKLLLMKDGRAEALGPRDEVLKKVLVPRTVTNAPAEAEQSVTG